MIQTIRLLGVEAEEARRELERHGIRAEPAELIGVARRLGRDLTVPEAFLLDVSFSEHCSYKSSRRFLKALLPPIARHVILGPGEDAGVVDLGTVEGDRYALVVAHESHNHPSQLLPVEGAATGIGGIVRDVYCMGADVIGVLDGLRFGDLDGVNGATARGVARGVIRGIWEYGNALGVPNLGGDLAFDACYDDNCLVNVVALGIARADEIIRSRVPEAARREPYVLVLIGKPTDRSGLGGASFASKILDPEAAETNLGAVQIHDPFLKRVLVEATKEVWNLIRASGDEVGFKDLGAGGFGGASSELALAGGFGAEIRLDELPAADAEPNPAHLLVGETQERFVWAIPERIAADVLAIYNEHFDLPGIYPGACARVVGRVIEEKRYRCSWNGQMAVDLPAEILEEAPTYDRPVRARAIAGEEGSLPEPEDWQSFAERLMSHPALCSRAHVYRHYDSEVRGEALIRPGEADGGVCRPIAGGFLGIAVSLDGNARWCDLDPYNGAAATVVEAVRNVVSVGARPLALTDCLNFGSPEDPECLWEFQECLRGMRDACIALGLLDGSADALPVVSGNVSFYNQSAGGARIRPTPIIACFGRIDDWRRSLRPHVQSPGSGIFMLGHAAKALGGSPALDLLSRSDLRLAPPRPVLARERLHLQAALGAIEEGLVIACHDFAEGGLLAAALEMLMREDGPTGLGLELALPDTSMGRAEFLLSESGGFLFEVEASLEEHFRESIRREGVEAIRLGRVVETPRLRIAGGGVPTIELDLRPIHRAWAERLGPWMEGGA